MKPLSSNIRFFLIFREFSRFYFSSFVLCYYFLFGVACAPLQIQERGESTSIGFEDNLTYSKVEFFDLEINANTTGNESQNSNYKPFPTDDNSIVRERLKHYSRGDGKITMKTVMERSTRYMGLMGDILEAEHLSRDFIYMSMVESGFKPRATSHAGAVGYWQFISSTAKVFDLRMDKWIDDRRDFGDSTQAAARYLKKLYATFGDWRLSMAGYNCGETCVSKAINKHGTKNFWALRSLPTETKKYVPTIIAMSKISKNPSGYGFHNLDYHAPLQYKLASLQSPSTLSSIANRAEASLSEIKALNPKYRTNRVPKNSGDYIRIPF